MNVLRFAEILKPLVKHILVMMEIKSTAMGAVQVVPLKMGIIALTVAPQLLMNVQRYVEMERP